MSSLKNARVRIDAADHKITEIVAGLSPTSQITAPQDIELPDTVSSMLYAHDTPLDLITSIIQYVDLKQLNDKQREFIALTASLIARYDAVLDVALYKREHPERFANAEGQYSSYDEVRHKDVIARNSRRIVELGGERSLAQNIYEILPRYCTHIQDEFLNVGTGPIAATLGARDQSKSKNNVLAGIFLGRRDESGNRLTKSNGCKASNEEGSLALQELAHNISSHSGVKSLTLTTGLGLSDKGVPLRLPSLLLPGLDMLRKLKSTGIDANYIVYQASDFITKMNGLNPQSAFNNAVMIGRYLEEFVETYFPDISDQVVILTGDKCKIDDGHLEALKEILRHSEGTEIEDSMRKIREYGSKQDSNDDSYLYYAAANVILNGGYGPHFPNDSYLTEDCAMIIPRGGRQEAPFFDITSYIAKTTGVDIKIVPSFVNVGQRPTYYPNPDGDLLVNASEDEVNSFTPPSSSISDIQALETRGITLKQLRSLTLA